MDNRFVTTEAMINSEAAGSSLTSSSSSDPRSGNSSINMLHQDTSVISAHDAHKGIYDLLSRLQPPPSLPASKLNPPGGLEPLANHSTSIDAVQGYFFRKKMLMQDANETRLWYNMKKSPKSYYY